MVDKCDEFFRAYRDMVPARGTSTCRKTPPRRVETTSCSGACGLQKQALFAQVRTNGGRRNPAWGEVFGVDYRYQISSNRRVNCEPFQGGVFSCQHPNICRLRAKAVPARRVRAMVRAIGMSFVRVVRRLCSRGCLRNVSGVVAKRGNGFAARKKCRIQPEHHPRQYHGHVRKPARNPWALYFWRCDCRCQRHGYKLHLGCCGLLIQVKLAS